MIKTGHAESGDCALPPATHRKRVRFRLTVLLIGLATVGAARMAGSPQTNVSIAAAANLTFAMRALNAEFMRTEPDVTLTTTLAASGTLFAQIANGAPFDVFLSADTIYPTKLVAAGHAERSSLRVFATGRLVFWTTRGNLQTSDIAAAVRSPQVRKIAIAQPATAPYGRAAEQALQQLGVAVAAKSKLVVGENIAQTAQFVETGNADAGFVALSLVKASRLANEGHWTEVPPTLYAAVSLEHGGVLTARGAQNPAARKYLAFLSSPRARAILEQQGYSVPGHGGAESGD